MSALDANGVEALAEFVFKYCHVTKAITMDFQGRNKYFKENERRLRAVPYLNDCSKFLQHLFESVHSNLAVCYPIKSKVI